MQSKAAGWAFLTCTLMWVLGLWIAFAHFGGTSWWLTHHSMPDEFTHREMVCEMYVLHGITLGALAWLGLMMLMLILETPFRVATVVKAALDKAVAEVTDWEEDR